METDMNYVAKCNTCGRLVGAAAGDLPKKELAKYVSQWIRAGYEIIQMKTEDVRKADWLCRCKKA